MFGKENTSPANRRPISPNSHNNKGKRADTPTFNKKDAKTFFTFLKGSNAFVPPKKQPNQFQRVNPTRLNQSKRSEAKPLREHQHPEELQNRRIDYRRQEQQLRKVPNEDYKYQNMTANPDGTNLRASQFSDSEISSSTTKIEHKRRANSPTKGLFHLNLTDLQPYTQRDNRNNNEKQYQNKVSTPNNRYTANSHRMFSDILFKDDEKVDHDDDNDQNSENNSNSVLSDKYYQSRKILSKNSSEGSISHVNEDPETSINSIPAFRQVVPLSSRSNYTSELPDTSLDSKSILSQIDKTPANNAAQQFQPGDTLKLYQPFQTVACDMMTSPKSLSKNVHEKKVNMRYTPVKCSLGELDFDIQPETSFEDVFIKAQGAELLDSLLKFLDIKDLFSLMKTSKLLYLEKKKFLKRFDKLKIRNKLKPNQRGEYWMVATQAQMLKELYGDPYYPSLMIKKCSFEREIQKDVDRTFLHINTFKKQQGQQALFRVLKAISVHYPELSYCQGMNFLAATFLLVRPEVDAFFLMMGLIKNFKFKSLFGDGMQGVLDMCKVFEWILQVYHPDLAEYFEQVDVNSMTFFMQWTLSLFSCSFDKSVVFQIWDIFFKQKWKFIFRLSLAIIKEVKEKLFKMPPENIVNYLKHLSKDHSFDIRKVLKQVDEIKLSNRLITELLEVAESKKEVKKVSLFFDPKIQKKSWRIEYAQNEEESDMIFRDTNRSHETEDPQESSRKTAGSFLSNFFDKIKQKLTLNDVRGYGKMKQLNQKYFFNYQSRDSLNITKEKERETQKSPVSDEKLLTIDESTDFNVYDENIAITPQARNAPNIFNTKVHGPIRPKDIKSPLKIPNVSKPTHATNFGTMFSQRSRTKTQ